MSDPGEIIGSTAEPVSVPVTPTLPSLIVGVGASAGGLEPLAALVAALPRGAGISLVVLQHQSPNFRSLLAPLLSRDTHMEVCEVSHGAELRPDTIFVAPSGFNVLLRGHQFILQRVSSAGLPRPSINLFLTSLSAHRDNAAAVILSGAGTDGADGAADIKAAGGLVLVQDPATAAFASMPQAALDKGCVDQALAPQEIARVLFQVARTENERVPESISAADEARLRQLFERVQQHTRADLSGYKQATVWRRLNRRMAATQQTTLEGYLRHIDLNPAELDAMATEILISVTSFYRDPAAFAAFATALAELVGSRPPQDTLRIWIAACATGEEAYTVAMLLMELLGPDAPMQRRVQIFATDIDIPAMAIARRGIYSADGAASLPAVLRERYLTPCAQGFAVRPAVREWVRFARHDLSQDPPFLRVDLICCRNVLIYFQPDVQSRVLQSLHYSLRPGGLLFLGQSEDVLQQDRLFSRLDSDARLFRRNDVPNKLPLKFLSRSRTAHLVERGSERPPAEQLSERFGATAGAHYIPPSVLINAKGEVQHVHGDISPYTGLSAGVPTLQLIPLVAKEFRVELTVLLRQAAASGTSVFGRPRARGKDRRRVRLAVHPEPVGTESWLVVSFEPYTARTRQAVAVFPESALVASQQDLAASQGQLRTAVAQMGLNDQEIESLAAEIQSANEELHSSNEELQSSNEELQSITEELSTVNEELQVRTVELSDSVGDLENVNNSIDIPLLVLGRGYAIHRYNRAAANAFGMTVNLRVKRLDPATLPEPLRLLDQWVDGVIDSQQPRSQKIELNGQLFVLNIHPYDSATRHLSLAVLVLVNQTHLLRTKTLLKEQSQQLQATLDNSPAVVATMDAAGRYLYVNPQFTKLFQLDAEHCLGKTDMQLFPAELANRFRAADLEVMRDSVSRETEQIVSVPSGTVQLLEIRFPLFADDGAISRICYQATDITARKDVENDLRLAATVFEQSPAAILIANPQLATVSVNSAFERITGFAEAAILGLEPLAQVAEYGEVDPLIWKTALDHGSWHGELSCKRPGGERFSAWVDIAAVKSTIGAPLSYVVTLNDLSPLKETHQRAEFLATHDALTELPNRRTFADRLEQAIRRAARNQTRLAVMFVDLDHFKYVNDTLGHDFGDALLRQCATLFRQTLRDADTVARLGGDEFAILMERISDDEIPLACERLLRAFRRPMNILGEMIYLTLSIGVTVCPDDDGTAVALMRNADAAMYRAKAQGRNDYHVYSATMRKELEMRHLLERDLRLALARSELNMIYQPQISLADGSCVGVEALLRWQHPRHGAINPADFIGIAEETDLIDDLTRWVFKEVIGQVRQWQDHGLMLPRVSINVSPRNFRRLDLAEVLCNLAIKSRVAPSSLCLEITENLLMDPHPVVRKRMEDLVEIGAKLSLDDFGTGYSSIAALAQWPLHELKLEARFTQRVVGSDADRALAAAILLLARSRGLETVAEGVETQAQADALIAMGFTTAQGFLFSAGVPGPELAQVLKTLPRRTVPGS